MNYLNKIARTLSGAKIKNQPN